MVRSASDCAWVRPVCLLTLIVAAGGMTQNSAQTPLAQGHTEPGPEAASHGSASASASVSALPPLRVEFESAAQSDIQSHKRKLQVQVDSTNASPLGGEATFPADVKLQLAVTDIGAGGARGQRAVDLIGASGRLPEVAAFYRMTPARLTNLLLADASLRLDNTGRLLYVEEPPSIILSQAGRLPGPTGNDTQPGASPSVLITCNSGWPGSGADSGQLARWGLQAAAPA
jgi:hypothetical protein